ncbi:MAG: preprotein translocase subunit SecG [Bacteroidales bacterium]|nr:preprotein translocase subunit SecG [Candidatus Cryptobacteroides aphodequi]
MNTVFTILTVLIVIASLLLVLVVLLQNGKGDGLASNFVAGNQTFGVRKTADILEKITWGLVAFIVIISIFASFSAGARRSEVNLDEAVQEVQTPEFPSAPAAQLPTEE